MDQTSNEEGTAVPTPTAEMSSTDSASAADPNLGTEAKPAELKLIEESLGREFETVEEAKESLRNLKSLVGDQTVSRQRKALEKLAQQANLTPDELLEVIDTQDISIPQGTGETPAESVTRNLPDENTKRITRVEVDTFVRDVPEASVVRDTLFAESLSTGKSVVDLWKQKYAPVIEAGKKLGAKKLQTNLEGQPTRATSVASESTDTKVDFSGTNPATGKLWTAKEMEKYIGYKEPTLGL